MSIKTTTHFSIAEMMPPWKEDSAWYSGLAGGIELEHHLKVLSTTEEHTLVTQQYPQKLTFRRHCRKECQIIAVSKSSTISQNGV